MKKYILLLLTFFISPATFSNPCNQNDLANAQQKILEAFSTQILNHKDSSGYVTAIGMVAQRGDHTPLSVYAGTSAINDSTAINNTSLFQIGSITKSFISVVILQLAQEKGFNLDDNTLLAKYFPEYPKWGSITLRQLLNMTSGIPGNGNKLPDDIFKKFTASEYTHYISPTTLLNLTYQLPLHFAPGTSYEYSNTNYTLLGQFIQRVTHHTPEYEVKARIIQKLGLQHTYFPNDTVQEIKEIKPSQIVHGYAFYPKDYAPYPFMHFGEDITTFSLSVFNTGGAMISTPADINRYLHALYHPGPLLNRAQIKALTTLVSRTDGTPFIASKATRDPLGYGLGIVGYYWPTGKRLIYLYNGVTNGFNFVYFYDPKTQQYLTFAVNSLADVIAFENSFVLFSKLTQG